MENFRGQNEKAEASELILRASKKAEVLIERDSIKMEGFDKYSKEGIEVDKKSIERLERKFKENQTPESVLGEHYGKILEGIIHEHGEMSDWFGEDASTIKTSRFDDIVNKVDEVIEFSDGDSFSFAGFTVDVTSNKNLGYKIDTIKDQINEGTLSSVKYFESENANFKGELNMLPRFIIGADSKTVIDLSELWVTGKNSELSKHFIQFQILEQVKKQSEVFAMYAEKVGQMEVKEVYDRVNRKIRQVISEREKTVRDSGDRDDVHNALSFELIVLKTS